MNESKAQARKTLSGWVAEYKLVRWSGYKTVMTDPEFGKPQIMIYPNKEAAEIAAWRALHKYEQPEILGHAQRETAMDRAEQEFNRVFGEART